MIRLLTILLFIYTSYVKSQSATYILNGEAVSANIYFNIKSNPKVIPDTSAYNTSWGAAASGNYTPLSSVTKVTTFVPIAANNNAYNHVPVIEQFGGELHLMYATGNTDEEESGQYIRYQKSLDDGATWSTAITLLAPQDIQGGLLARRICLPASFAVIDNELYAVVDVNDRGSGAGGSRTGVGALAVKVNNDQTFDTPVWITNINGSASAPGPISGFTSYIFDTGLSTGIVNYFTNNPEKRPDFFFSVPPGHPLLTKQTLTSGSYSVEEPTTTILPTELYLRVWRKISSAAKKVIQFSIDGINWGPGFSSNIPDFTARSCIRKASNGNIYLIGNNSSAVRSPLFFAYSLDGLKYISTNIYNIDTETSGAVYSGSHKDIGVQYPNAIQLPNGKIIVSYSVNKEQIRVAIFDLPLLSTNGTFVSSPFQKIRSSQ